MNKQLVIMLLKNIKKCMLSGESYRGVYFFDRLVNHIGIEKATQITMELKGSLQ